MLHPRSKAEDPMKKSLAFKVLRSAELDELRQSGTFLGNAADRSGGFIHLSTAGQLEQTVKKHYHDGSDAFILALDIGLADKLIRWEAASNGQKYPHLYGPLELNLVLALAPIRRRDDGTLDIPLAA